MVAMPATRELVMAAGANMSNYFIDTPICCPSRTTFMSGKYVHNNKVSDNQAGGCMRMNTSRAMMYGVHYNRAPLYNCSTNAKNTLVYLVRHQYTYLREYFLYG